MLRPIEKTSLAASVFVQIRDRVLDGSLSAGEALPAERQLAAQLRVNRSAVREALKRLEQAGLIAIQHGGKTRVLDYRHHAGLGIVSALLPHRPELRDDLAALLRTVFPACCREAARNATATQIDRLEMLVTLAAGRAEHELHDLTVELWSVMVDASCNLAFRLIYNDLPPSVIPAASPRALLALTNAVAAGDTRGATLAAEELLR